MDDKYHHINDSDVNAIRNLCQTINDWADKKGWNEEEDSVQFKATQIALMHSELSEMLEFIRKKAVPDKCPHCHFDYFGERLANSLFRCGNCDCKIEFSEVPMDDHVPELTGEEAELADLLIRAFHYAGKRNIDLGRAVQMKHAYNIQRSYRHGKHI